eukprot:TRINITY_DN1363_c0_g2_i1.p1 TRINITY_DN1363_c0_g2~~TRINITY_DN1363_c0_g2_i1.p1  ORF type:complete len:293 (-),score=34.38 TRINITY_DN1363_c0_g2_i1:270-1100(-)
MVSERALVAVIACHVFGGAAGVDIGASHKRLRVVPSSLSDTGSFVQGLEFKHRLRVCNAYPSHATLDVFRGTSQKLTDTPVAYKQCQEFVALLQIGDKLDFMLGDTSAGTFSVTDLPSNDAVLLLVLHRHDASSTAVSFESHVFAKLMNSQVAVIDTYRGTATSVPKIADEAASKSGRSEQLRYGSVVAVNPGKYDVVLEGLDGQVKSRSSLVAVDRESYVVLRTGGDGPQGDSYPEEVVVFPKSDPALLHSGAAPSNSVTITVGIVLVTLVAFVF